MPCIICCVTVCCVHVLLQRIHNVRKPAASRTHGRLKSGHMNLFTHFVFGVSRSGISINSITADSVEGEWGEGGKEVGERELQLARGHTVRFPRERACLEQNSIAGGPTKGCGDFIAVILSPWRCSSPGIHSASTPKLFLFRTKVD